MQTHSSPPSSHSGVRETFDESIQLLTRAIADGRYVPRFQDATNLVAAKEGKGRRIPMTPLDHEAPFTEHARHALHLLTNALVGGSYQPQKDGNLSKLITTINQALDQELRERHHGMKTH